MAIEGTISGVSIAHQYADVETIAAATPESTEDYLDRLLDRDGVSEAFVLTTCNRAEWYVVTDHPQLGRTIVNEFVDDLASSTWRQLRHDEAIEHLLRVTSGLESQVLGEDEIIGQVREAYHLAESMGAIGDLLEPVLMKALHVGERARTETAINEGVVSLASAAVRCVEDHVHLPGSTVAVVGAGETGAQAARSLVDAEVGQLYVVNRTLERAEAVCSTIETGQARPLTELSATVAEADVVITATNSQQPVVTADTMAATGSSIIVDLGQPPDVHESVRERATVAYFDLDRLRRITERTHTRRRGEAEAVETMIERELEVLGRAFKRARAEEVIGAMRSGAERIKAAEVKRAKLRLEASDDAPETILEDFADAVVNAIMAPPTEALREAAEDDDWTTIASAIQIFDPDLDEGELPPALAEAATSDQD